MSVHGSKLEVNKGYVDRNMVGLEGGEISVTVLDQEYVVCDGKEPVVLC